MFYIPFNIAGMKSACASVGHSTLGKAFCRADAIGARMPAASKVRTISVGEITNEREEYACALRETEFI